MLIGLSGGMAVGKDTTYLRTKKLFPSEVVERVAFGDMLKASAAASLGVSQDFIEQEKRNPNARVIVSSPVVDDQGQISQQETSISLREYVQRYGTEGHRHIFGDQFWVDITLPRDFDHSNKIVFVTDARFASEQQRIIDLGGINVHVEGPVAHSESGLQHESESAYDLDLVSYTISNAVRDDNFVDLDRQIVSIINSVLVTTGE